MVEYEFSAHKSHAILPDVVLNFPATQPAHVLVDAVIVPVYPASHMHCVTALLACPEDEDAGHGKHAPALVAASEAEYVFVGHNVQFPVPLAALYVPSPHAKHETPVRPGLFCGQYPILHVQFTSSPLDAGDDEYVGHNSHWLRFACEYLPAGHCRHDSICVPPDDDEYVPGPHSEHSVSPNTLYVPGLQSRHVAFAAPRLLV